MTVSIGTVQGGGITTVGNSCFMMASSHIAHDCVVGNNVTFANNVALGGHVIIGDHVFLGGQSAVHQYNWVGEGAMIGGVAGVTKDVIPFGFAMGPIPAYLAGLNVVGLKRRGYSRSDMAPHPPRITACCSTDREHLRSAPRSAEAEVCRRSAGRKDIGFHPRQAAAPVDDGGEVEKAGASDEI